DDVQFWHIASARRGANVRTRSQQSGTRGGSPQGADAPGETRIEAHSPMAARFLAGRPVLWKVERSKQRELADGDPPAGAGLCRRAARRDARRNRGGRRRI